MTGCDSLMSRERQIVDTACLSGSFVPLGEDIKGVSDELIHWTYRHNAGLCHCDWIRFDPRKVIFCNRIKEEMKARIENE